MALVECRECGSKVSSKAKTCPQCGIDKPQPKRTGVLTWIIALLIGAGVLSSVLSGSKREVEKEASAPTLTPAQIAERDRTKKALEAAYQRQRLAVASFMLAVKRSARNPATVQWESVGATADGSVVCGKFRAQNGFGGFNKESASWVNEKLSLAAGPWNKYCLKGLEDVTAMARTLE